MPKRTHLQPKRFLVAERSGAASYPSGGPAEDPITQLERLAQLHRDGALTDEEFAAEKHRILSR